MAKTTGQRCCNIHKKIPVFESLLGLNACKFTKKRLQHGSFPVNIVKFLNTPILKIIFERLLLLESDYICWFA